MDTDSTTTAAAGARGGHPAERWAAARLGRWRWILPLLPAMLSFGPLFMVMGPSATVANYVGAIMLSVALIAQFIIMSRLAGDAASPSATTGNETTGRATPAGP